MNDLTTEKRTEWREDAEAHFHAKEGLSFDWCDYCARLALLDALDKTESELAQWRAIAESQKHVASNHLAVQATLAALRYEIKKLADKWANPWTGEDGRLPATISFREAARTLFGLLAEPTATESEFPGKVIGRRLEALNDAGEQCGVWKIQGSTTEEWARSCAARYTPEATRTRMITTYEVEADD